jgi:hypothetical protein
MQLFGFLFEELVNRFEELDFSRELLLYSGTAEYIFKVNPVLLAVKPIVYCLLG